MILPIVFLENCAKIGSYRESNGIINRGYIFEEDLEMKKRVLALVAVLAFSGVLAVGCGNKKKETEAPATEAVTTEAAATEAETTEAAATEAEETEAQTTEAAATEAETTEAATEA